MKKKVIALVLVCVLVFGIAVGGTLAWLMDKTNTVTNTFTVGNVNIKLTENGDEINSNTTKNFKIVPGVDFEKDAVVTVLEGSENCWLFVKVAEANRAVVGADPAKNYFDYEIDTGWAKLTGGDLGLATGETVYYREVNATTDDDVSYDILKEYATDIQINVSDELTKAEIDELNGTPSLAFTAYAVQRANFDTAAAAWAEAKTLG